MFRPQAGQDSLSHTGHVSGTSLPPHVAGSRSVLVFRRTDGGIVFRLFTPSEYSHAETKAGSQGCPLPFLGLPVMLLRHTQEGWKEHLGASLCSLGNQAAVSLCPRQPAGEWKPRIEVGQSTQGRFLVAMGNAPFSGASQDGHIHSSLGASVTGGARPWLDLQTLGVDKASQT